MASKGPVELYDPRKYLETLYCSIRMPDEPPQLLETMLKNYQDFFAKVPDGESLVDIGTGATIHTLIVESKKFKNITCAEYTEANRNELNKWLSGSQDAFDWNLFFKFVAILEGHCEPENYIGTLEKRVHSAVKDVVYCNVLEDPILEDTSKRFDVVATTFCLEEACKSNEDLNAAVRRIAGILKPNGHLILSMLMEESSCKLDDEVVISCLPITDQQLTSALEAAGFVIQETHRYLPDPNDPVESEDNNFSHALFLLAKKCN